MEEQAMYKPLDFSPSVNLMGRCLHLSVLLTMFAACKANQLLSVLLTCPVVVKLKVTVVVVVHFVLYPVRSTGTL
eukprot:5718713-Amphidinium_carterae.1